MRTILLCFLVAACGGGDGSDIVSDRPDARTSGAPDAWAGLVVDATLVGSWSCTQAIFFPDTGPPGTDLPQYLGEQLVLKGDGTFTVATAAGTWGVGQIEPADWTRWGLGPYDEDEKIVLMGSANFIDGPILGGAIQLVAPVTSPAAGKDELQFTRPKR